MSGWAKTLPRVTAPQCDVAKPVTLIVPYYENPVFLDTQIRHWFTMPADLRANASLVIVDDGSPVAPAEAVIRGYQIGWASMRLLRIELDVRWNWLAARNIGFHHAAEGWCLVTDMDHVVNELTLRAVIYGSHEPDVIYGFRRIDARCDSSSAEIDPHPNSWLLTRAMFWKVGGYDEALSGKYGTDGDWRRRCAKVAPIHILSDVLLRYEHQQDSSTTRYQRKQPEDAAVREIVAGRGPGWTPKTLSFPYHEVAL